MLDVLAAGGRSALGELRDQPELLRLRFFLVRLRTRLKNRIHGTLSPHMGRATDLLRQLLLRSVHEGIDRRRRGCSGRLRITEAGLNKSHAKRPHGKNRNTTSQTIRGDFPLRRPSFIAQRLRRTPGKLGQPQRKKSKFPRTRPAWSVRLPKITADSDHRYRNISRANTSLV